MYPSGFAFATKPAPTIAPAPGLFSITIGCPSRFPTTSAAARAMRSLAPPGPKGTTHLIGRSGQSASAPPDAISAKAATTRAVATALCGRRAYIRFFRGNLMMAGVPTARWTGNSTPSETARRRRRSGLARLAIVDAPLRFGDEFLELGVHRTARRYDSDRLALHDHGQMAKPAFVHQHQRVAERLFRIDGPRIAGHDIADRSRIGIEAVREHANQGVPLGEDPDQLLALDDENRADVSRGHQLCGLCDDRRRRRQQELAPLHDFLDGPVKHCVSGVKLRRCVEPGPHVRSDGWEALRRRGQRRPAPPGFVVDSRPYAACSRTALTSINALR